MRSRTRSPTIKALTFFATRGGIQAAPRPITTASGQTLMPVRSERVIAACDVVTQIHRGYAENPAASGNWVDLLSWDTFRVRNGKLIEHRDGTFRLPPQPAAPRN